MDILYIYRRTSQEELELRYSLRSVAKHLPYLGKVWIFGDQPAFLCDDPSMIEHVPQEHTAGITNYRLPVVNLFLQVFLGSLIPNLAPEFLLFADDYVLIDFVPEAEMRKDRALEDLSLLLASGMRELPGGVSKDSQASHPHAGTRRQLPGGVSQNVHRDTAGPKATALSRGSLWKEALWRTLDLLARFDLPLFNFEAHVPAFMTKARVLEAFCAFRDFITEDRLYGPLACTSILNLAAKHDPANVVLLSEEKSRAGVYAPVDLATIRAHCAGKKFLNFDEAGFNDQMRRHLDETFPARSRYETTAVQRPSRAPNEIRTRSPSFDGAIGCPVGAKEYSRGCQPTGNVEK
jgi:hypothetical protein